MSFIPHFSALETWNQLDQKMAKLVEWSVMFLTLCHSLLVLSLPHYGATADKETWIGRALWENDEGLDVWVQDAKKDHTVIFKTLEI